MLVVLSLGLGWYSVGLSFHLIGLFSGWLYALVLLLFVICFLYLFVFMVCVVILWLGFGFRLAV